MTTTPSSAAPGAWRLKVWERFSFLGMQGILVLYFADPVANGGPGMNPGAAASVSAAYGTMVYLVSVAGGWLADRILGSYRAVPWGGILIACGHYAMAVPTAAMTWAGLVLIGAGTGLLKRGTTAGLIQYVLGRRHPAGRNHSADHPLAPAAMRSAVTKIIGDCLAFAALATLPADLGRLTMGRFVDLLCGAPCTRFTKAVRA